MYKKILDKTMNAKLSHRVICDLQVAFKIPDRDRVFIDYL